MPQFLYVFGYCTPFQERNNARSLYWNDEDSRAVWIEADSAELALDWGREISERFVRKLFADPSMSWKEREFAHWIEQEALVRWTAESLASVPMVRSGEYPVW